ncbi:MAG: PD-(D/E)XK nuclease family protein [Candidatus Aenigmatarchaeota archaeon]
MIDFNKMIDNHLAKDKRPKQAGRYYPSEIGTCMRKTWYSYKFPLDITPALMKIFELGNILHDFVVEVLKSDKNPNIELLRAEMPLKMEFDEFIVSGRIDDLLLIKDRGQQILVEVKSCKNIKFVNGPQKHHAMQLQFYMHASGVHNGVLLYIDKTTLQSKVFPVAYEDLNAKMIEKRFTILHEHVRDNILPLPEAKMNTIDGWLCNFCEYKNKCDQNKGIDN